MTHPPLLRYGVAVLTTLVFVVLRSALWPLLGAEAPLLLLLPAIMLAAWYGGFGPGAVASGLAALLGSFLFLPPFSQWSLSQPVDWLVLSLFFSVGLAVSWVISLLHRARQRSEESLRQTHASEQHLRRVLNNLFAFVGMLEPDGALIDANEAPLRAAGIALDEVRGKKFWDCYWWNYADEVRDRVRDACERAARGETVRYDATVRVAGDSRMTIDFQIAPLRDAEGRITHLIPSGTDITERRRMEEALRSSESFYRQTLESIPGMTFTNRPDGSCDYVSEQWVEFTGIPAEAHLGEGWIQVVHPADRERAFAAWRAAVEGRGQYDLEYRVRRRDGVYEWFKVRGQAIRDASGAIVRWFGTAVNVDDLKRVEEALRQSEERLRLSERRLSTLVDNLPDIVSRVDRELRHQFICPSITRFTGLTPVDYLGKTNRDLGMPPDLCDYWDAEMEAVFVEGRPRTIQFPFTSPEGEVRHFESRFIPEFTDESPNGADPGASPSSLLVVTRDITEQVQAAQAVREASRRKDEFLAMLAHELRNPLGPILNSVAVLRARGSADPVLERHREVIRRQVEHMARLVSDLLDVSRINRGKLSLQREILDLAASARSCVEDYQEELEHRGIAVRLELPSEPVCVYGDHVRLCQALGNLLGNAGKFTPAGGRITVALHTDRVENEERAVITVTDTGAGISPEILPTIWDSFVQGKQDMARSGGGLGLGLALVKGVVEMHGGTVSAASAGPGQGAEFTFTLPRTTGVESVRPSPPQVLPEPALPVAADCRILIIEDNRDAAETLGELLSDEGYEIRLALDGVSGVEIARDWSPHAVLCDIGLPGMDGYSVAKALRQEAATAEACLVAISGYAQAEDADRGRRAGFDRYLAKPVDPETLLKLLHELLNGSRPREVS